MTSGLLPLVVCLFPLRRKTPTLAKTTSSTNPINTKVLPVKYPGCLGAVSVPAVCGLRGVEDNPPGFDAGRVLSMPPDSGRRTVSGRGLLSGGDEIGFFRMVGPSAVCKVC